MIFAAPTLSLLASVGGLAAPSVDRPPSILLIILDDVGVDKIGVYGDPTSPCTPNIDALAAVGVRFSRAYANPTCSPTRAAMYTGRLGYRTGIGTAILEQRQNHAGLADSEVTLFEHLSASGIPTAFTGKWHLKGTSQAATNPNDQGCGTFRGSLGGLMPNYYRWDRTVDGMTKRSTIYATQQTALDAAEQITAMPEPWLGVVSFNAAHSRFHPAPKPRCKPSRGGAVENYRSMVENLDAHVGTLVRGALQLTGGNLWVFVYGDNGTPKYVDADCPAGAKGLVLEGGILVPLIVYGPGVVPGVRDDLISPTDFFSTITELVGAPGAATAVDSVSFASALTGGPASKRTGVFAEFFAPNGKSPAASVAGSRFEWRHAYVEKRWKLVRNSGARGKLPPEAFFDLLNDPCESTNLLGVTLTAEVKANYDRLLELMEGVEADARLAASSIPE